MEDNATPSQEQLWSQTTKNARNDLNIPMEVISTQSNRMAHDWLDGFSEMMFEGVTRKKDGKIDFSKKFKPRMIQVDTQTSSDGSTSSKTLTVPLLAVAQYPAIGMDTITFKLSYNVGSTSEAIDTDHSENSTSLSANAGVDGKFGALNFSAAFTATTTFAASSDSSRKRNTDSRATLDVTATYARIPVAEGMSRLTEALLSSSLPIK